MFRDFKRILFQNLGIAALVLSSCADKTSVGPISSQSAPIPAVTKEVAMRIATDEIANMRRNGDDCGWTAGAKVVDAFEIYQGTLKNKAYFECKIRDGEKDAGYVLVTANKTDLLIPESCPKGKTLTEYYRETLRSDSVKVIRFDWFMSAAVDGNGKVLSSKGFFINIDNTMQLRKMTDDEISKAIESMQNKYASGVFPLYTPNMLSQYYAGSEKQTKGPITTAGSWKEIYASLSHTFPDGNQTPLWAQTPNPNTSNVPPIGCGPTAWAILYAYWAEFKGCGFLFDTRITTRTKSWNTGDNDIWHCMTYTAELMGSILTDDWGLTWTWDMTKGIDYAKNRGYDGSVTRDRGSEYSKFDKIYGSIFEDRPCILAIGWNTPWANHYVVVEKCKKSQYQYAWVWHDRNVYYSVNCGWGESSKWLCVRDWGADQNPVGLAFSAYMVDIKYGSWKNLINLRTCNGHYVCAENGRGSSVNATRTSAGVWETFNIYDLGGGDLQSGNVINFITAYGGLVRAIGGGGGSLDACATDPYAWESFIIQKVSPGDATIRSGDKVSIRTFSAQQYLCAENGGGGALNANRAAVGEWETFTISGAF